jgi:hypothetical protein
LFFTLLFFEIFNIFANNLISFEAAEELPNTRVHDPQMQLCNSLSLLVIITLSKIVNPKTQLSGENQFPKARFHIVAQHIAQCGLG